MTTCEAAAALATVNDDHLMACVKSGSVVGLGVLYDRYSDRAYRIARSVCRDDGRAGEAVQEAFISIWKTRASYDRTVGTVASWLLTVVRYRAIDIARSNGAHVAHRAGADNLDGVSAPNSVEEHVVARIQSQHLCDLLAQLPGAQREVITLAFYGQLSHSEIAAHLGLALGTVKGRMRRGLEGLRGDINRVVG